MAQDNGTVLVHQIEMKKKAGRALDRMVLAEHAAALVGTVTRAGSKWTLELRNADTQTDWFKMVLLSENPNGPREYALYFELRGPNSGHADIQIDDHLAALTKTGKSFSGNPWIITRKDGEDYAPLTAQEKRERKALRDGDTVGYADASMPSDARDYFQDLYGIDAQVKIILGRMRTAINSDFRKRFHGVLLGPPGVGKSHTLRCAKEMFGDDAVMQFDGTAMTSAGISKELDKLDVLPRFVFVEEIDKAPNDAVSVLLGLMDDRGELRKTTYRDNIQKDCRVVVFATANSFEQLKKMQMGALKSRFGAPITYKRPDDVMMRMILNRELDELEEGHNHSEDKANCVTCCKPTLQGEKSVRCGKCVTCKRRAAWIERTLEWCADGEKMGDVEDRMDPRYAISVCLNGGNELLTGEYQEDMRATMVTVGEIVEFN